MWFAKFMFRDYYVDLCIESFLILLQTNIHCVSLISIIFSKEVCNTLSCFNQLTCQILYSMSTTILSDLLILFKLSFVYRNIVLTSKSSQYSDFGKLVKKKFATSNPTTNE